MRTKADLVQDGAAPGGEAGGTPGEVVSVSAVTGLGLDTLRERMVEIAFGGIRSVGEEPVITRERHARALRSAADELERFLEAIDADVPLAIAATHLRAAAGSIEDLIGLVTPDDVLDVVFGQFCVGK